MQRSALCRSRRELSNEYFLAKIGVDTAENEPLEVWGEIFNIIHWCPYPVHVREVHDRGAVRDEQDRAERPADHARDARFERQRATLPEVGLRRTRQDPAVV